MTVTNGDPGGARGEWTRDPRLGAAAWYTIPIMARTGPRAFAVAVAVALALALSAVAAGPPRPVDEAELRSLVEWLDAADPADRLAAERQLAAAGSRAVGVLTAAQGDDRPEVAARAARALRRVRLFTLKGLPLTALPLAAAYLADDATPATRAGVVQELARIAPTPVPVLVRLMLLEARPGLRAQLMSVVGSRYREAVPGLLADGDADGVAAVVEQALVDLPAVGAGDHAVLMQLTGRWDEAAARWRAEAVNGNPTRRAAAAGVVAALCRVAGRLDEAADAARRCGDPRVPFTIALDRSDWATAASLLGAVYPGGQPMPLRAALSRLAGREADVTAAVATIGPDDPKSLSVGQVRLLLGDVAGGMASLTAAPTDGGDPPAAVALLGARGQYAAALALADRYAADPAVGPAVVAERDRLRQLLGDAPRPTSRATDPPVPDAAPDADDTPEWRAAVTAVVAGRFADAAAALAVHDRDVDRLDHHYLRGFALAASGGSPEQVDRGRAMMHDAVLAPLADAARRRWLAGRLASVGTAALDAAAADQRQLAQRSADPLADPAAVTDGLLADQAMAVKRHDDVPAAALARAAERTWLFSFWPGIDWRDPARYLTVPLALHLARARAARAGDDWPAVSAELAAARPFLPGSIEVALAWVPLLDEHGDHAAADALFAAGYDPVDAAAVDHPRSVYLHNQAAWLAACANRRLDAALAHAEAAVRLSGGTDGGYLDTLAECQFRRGDRATAIATERRAATQPGGTEAAYFARQVARFERSPVPSTTRPVGAPE